MRKSTLLSKCRQKAQPSNAQRHPSDRLHIILIRVHHSAHTGLSPKQSRCMPVCTPASLPANPARTFTCTAISSSSKDIVKSSHSRADRQLLPASLALGFSAPPAVSPLQKPGATTLYTTSSLISPSAASYQCHRGIRVSSAASGSRRPSPCPPLS